MIRPSGVRLSLPLPLVDTLGRSELEVAAAMVIRACQVHGDAWQAVTPSMMGELLQSDPPDPFFVSVASNPSLNPDFRDLVKQGYATADFAAKNAPLTLNQTAIDRICAKHGRPASGGPQ